MKEILMRMNFHQQMKILLNTTMGPKKIQSIIDKLINSWEDDELD